MKKIIGIIFLFSLTLILINFVVAQATPGMDETEYQKQLEQLKNSGVLSDTLISNIDKLSAIQKENLLLQVEGLSNENFNKFFSQWNSQLSAENKNNLLKSVSQSSRVAFFNAAKKYYGFELKGFGENFKGNLGFGTKNGIIGNEELFFDAERIKNYNQRVKDSGNKIASVEYKIANNKETLIIKKQNGATAEVIVSSDKTKRGYYFDPETNKFYRLKSQEGNFIPDTNDPLTGAWNGKGELTIDASGDKTKISLDFKRKDGVADIYNFATFTTPNGDVYGVYRRPTGRVDEKGNIIYESNKAEVTIDSNGKPILLSNVNWENKKINGFFGKDVRVLYSKEAYDTLSAKNKAKLGSYLIIDEKTGFIGGDLARTPEGVIPDMEKYAEDLKKEMEKQKIKVEVAKVAITAGSFLSEEQRQKIIAQQLGLSPDNLLVKKLATKEGMNLIQSSLNYGSKFLGAAEDVTGRTIGLMQGVGEENPILKTMVPAEGSFMSLQLKNDFAKVVKNIDLRGGTLDIQDNQGKYVRVLDLTTPYSYMFNPKMTQQSYNFQGINFNLVNHNLPDQQIQVYSDNQGKLQARGVGGLSHLTGVGSLNLYGQGTVYLGPRGRIVISQTEGIASASLGIDSTALSRAQEYLSNQNEEYRALYEKYKKDGFDETEIKELNLRASAITSGYYQRLRGSDLSFSISSLPNSQPYQFSQSVSGLSEQLDAFANTLSSQGINPDLSNPVVREVIGASIQNVLSDKSFQDQLSQRGLTSPSAIEAAAKTQIREIAEFLRTNSGYSLEYIADSKNKLYQFKYGSNTLNLDPALAPIVRDMLPMIVGSGRVDNQGKFYIDNAVWDSNHNRFLGDKTIVFSAATSSRIIPAIKDRGASIKATLEEAIKQQATNFLIRP